MAFSHSLVLITGKRLETNLRCSCRSSIRRKHLFLWPQGTVPRCAEFVIFQGWSEDTLTKLVSAVGSLFRQRFVPVIEEPQLLLFSIFTFFCRLSGVFCASEQAQLKSMAGPGGAILNINKLVQAFLSLTDHPKLLLPSPISSSSWVVLPSPALGCPRGQAKEWLLQRRQPLTQGDLRCETQELPSPWHHSSRITCFLRRKHRSFFEPIQVLM